MITVFKTKFAGSCVDASKGKMSDAWVTPPTPWGNTEYWHHGTCSGK